uniref:Uncharacterized protein n=1 Tax=Candidatus Kentrum sp. LPFa TaxID=2126335 RepID=A0A450W4D8_9GAMM|nr:MAG: hypothetical protein BECKLPF1236B_GA0070989_102712 [Candidatus Kentron sp. LPFa]
MGTHSDGKWALIPSESGHLVPSETSDSAVDFDDLRLIAWTPRDAAYNPLYDRVLVAGRVNLEISRDIPPGAEED